MKKLVSYMLLFFLAYNSSAQIDFFTGTDTIYRLTDPGIECIVDRDKYFLWDFYDLNIPCYSKGVISSDTERVTIDYSKDDNISYLNRANGVFLKSSKSFDPFTNSLYSELELKDALKLKAKDASIGNSWSDKSECSITIYNTEDLSAGKYSRFIWNGTISNKCVVEAINKIKVPGTNVDATLIVTDYALIVKSIQGEREGVLQELTNEEIARLGSDFKKKIWTQYNYWAERSPYLIASLNTDNNQNCQTFDFYSNQVPSMLDNCYRQKHRIYLYPNPSFGDVNIQFVNEKKGKYQFVIYDIIGQKLLEKEIEITNTNQITKLDLTFLPKGTFLYGILDEKGDRLVTKKLVIISI